MLGGGADPHLGTPERYGDSFIVIPIAANSPARDAVACRASSHTKRVRLALLQGWTAIKVVGEDAIGHRFERADIARQTLRPCEATLIDWQTAWRRDLNALHPEHKNCKTSGVIVPS